MSHSKAEKMSCIEPGVTEWVGFGDLDIFEYPTGSVSGEDDDQEEEEKDPLYIESREQLGKKVGEHNPAIVSNRPEGSKREEMATIPFDLVERVKSGEEKSGSAELIPVYVDFGENQEKDVDEVSEPRVFVEECSLDDDHDRDEKATFGHKKVGESIEDDLEEVDFYIERKLLDDARNTLNVLTASVPDTSLVTAKVEKIKLVEVETGSMKADTITDSNSVEDDANSSRTGSGIGLVELEKMINDLFETDNISEKDSGESMDFPDLDSIPIIRPTSPIEDAVQNFVESVCSDEHEVLCHMIAGRQFLEREMPAFAIRHFKKGLHVSGVTEQEKMAFYFELGMTYEYSNNPGEAAYYYTKVNRFNPYYKGVAKRLEYLRGK